MKPTTILSFNTSGLTERHSWQKETTYCVITNGGQPLCNTDNVSLIDEINTECHRITCYTLCTFKNDTIECFYRMIPIQSMLNSRKFGVPDQICTLYAKTLNHTKYYIKTALSTSTISYTSTEERKIYGQGQGAGPSGTSWKFISVPLMITLDKSCIEKIYNRFCR